MSRKPLSLPQIVILALLWVAICYIILTGSEQIDGPLILSISLYSFTKVFKEQGKIIFYSYFRLHFVQSDIFYSIFFIICCIIQFLSIFLHRQ